jgi:hypothetical protein
MQSDAVMRRLERAAQYQAARLGYEFGEDSWSLTLDLLERATERLVASSVHDRESYLAMAEAAVAAFVARMVVEAEDSSLAQLRENTFGAASTFFCPLWPIC